MYKISMPGLVIECNSKSELDECISYLGPIHDYTVDVIIPIPSTHHPDCGCIVCVYGQDEYIRNFHPYEY